MVHNIQRCQECILQKNNVCIYKSQDEPCERCQEQYVKSTHLFVTHAYGDMQASQCFAQEIMQTEAPSEIQNLRYIQCGFGVLHICKALVGYVCNYRITDGINTFCINMLVALWLSSTFPPYLLARVNAKSFFI